MKIYNISINSKQKGVIYAHSDMSSEEQAKKLYQNVVSDIEEEQGMMMNIKQVWDVRPCGYTILSERIETCTGDVITAELSFYEV